MDVVPTIPATWSPSPDCLASTDLWDWWRSTTAELVLGGPVETESCYPPGYTGTTSEYYEATACPTGFTSACNNAGLTTCCPRAYEFDCNLNTYWAYFDATTLPCTSHWPTEGLTTTLTVTYTKLGNRAQSVESYTVTRTIGSSTVTFTTSGLFTTTVVVDDAATLFAMAVAISSPTTTSGITSNTGASQPPVATSTSAASNQSGSGGLSARTAAGVGIGVAVGVLLLAAAAFFIIHRRRQRRRLLPTEGHDSSDAGVLQFQDIHKKPDLPQPSEMAANERPVELPT